MQHGTAHISKGIVRLISLFYLRHSVGSKSEKKKRKRKEKKKRKKEKKLEKKRKRKEKKRKKKEDEKLKESNAVEMNIPSETKKGKGGYH